MLIQKFLLFPLLAAATSITSGAQVKIRSLADDLGDFTQLYRRQVGHNGLSSIPQNEAEAQKSDSPQTSSGVVADGECNPRLQRRMLAVAAYTGAKVAPKVIQCLKRSKTLKSLLGVSSKGKGKTSVKGKASGGRGFSRGRSSHRGSTSRDERSSSRYRDPSSSRYRDPSTGHRRSRSQRGGRTSSQGPQSRYQRSRSQSGGRSVSRTPSRYGEHDAGGRRVFRASSPLAQSRHGRARMGPNDYHQGPPQQGQQMSGPRINPQANIQYFQPRPVGSSAASPGPQAPPSQPRRSARLGNIAKGALNPWTGMMVLDGKRYLDERKDRKATAAATQSSGSESESESDSSYDANRRHRSNQHQDDKRQPRRQDSFESSASDSESDHKPLRSILKKTNQPNQPKPPVRQDSTGASGYSSSTDSDAPPLPPRPAMSEQRRKQGSPPPPARQDSTTSESSFELPARQDSYERRRPPAPSPPRSGDLKRTPSVRFNENLLIEEYSPNSPVNARPMSDSE